MMNKLENEVLLSRRAALGAFATVTLGTAGLLAGCGSDKATVTEDAGDGDKKEEAKKEEDAKEAKEEEVVDEFPDEICLDPLTEKTDVEWRVC